MSHPFLSDEWIAAARDIRAKYSDVSAKVSIPMRINQVVTAVPFGDGTVVSHIDTTSGEVMMELGALDAPDATITTDYATARALFVDQDQAAAMQAFMSGKVKVEGDMMKIMSMQTAIPQDEVAKTIAEEIRAITA